MTAHDPHTLYHYRDILLHSYKLQNYWRIRCSIDIRAKTGITNTQNISNTQISQILLPWHLDIQNMLCQNCRTKLYVQTTVRI